jgi:hypothetical protein
MKLGKYKWAIIAGIIVIIAIAVIAYFIGQSSSNQPSSAVSATTSTTSTAQAPIAAPSVPPTPTFSQRTSSTSDPNWQLNPPAITSMYTTHGLQQGFILATIGASQITLGQTSFSDTITDLGQTISPNSLSWSPLTKDTTTGQFVELDLTMNNNGQKGETINTVPIGIYDQVGRYYPDSGNEQSSCGVEPSGDQTISPDIPCIQKIVFEVGKDSTSYTYKFYYKQEN